ncbi:hypothetical protein AAFC00_001902 [Neodothiora populina]|uniref:Alpha-ketoglutarate-dependent dioxygenase AlkB-like domain-containing protein n=1 Tax=Neodothiora populina TaxID=2781224 RepID=A0ABR3PQJ0_9PEZI
MDLSDAAEVSPSDTPTSNSRPARDTHALPPDHICEAYWKYNKIKPADLDNDPDVVDFGRGLSPAQAEKIHVVKTVSSETIAEAGRAFKYFGQDGSGDEGEGERWLDDERPKACNVYEFDDFPGLQLYHSLLPPEIQVLFLSRIMHRDLSNPNHKTNINSEYDVPYPLLIESKSEDDTSSTSNDTNEQDQPNDPQAPRHSFFTLPPQSNGTKNNANKWTLRPLPSSTTTNKPLKPLNPAQHLTKKLRWLTLGHQYNWPTRSYSGLDSTRFPPDIESLVSHLFPATTTKAESGVVLLYSTKDYMPVHRDVSETCDLPLASFSLGCDGLFVIAADSTVPAEDAKAEEGEGEGEGAEADRKIIVLRVKSGDVVIMSGATRWAWHAMPKVIPGTCPEFMREWPVGSERGMGAGVADEEDEDVYEKWRGFMVGKRLNISCRQVFD